MWNQTNGFWMPAGGEWVDVPEDEVPVEKREEAVCLVTGKYAMDLRS